MIDELIKRELIARKISPHEVNMEHIIIILETLLRDRTLQEKSGTELLVRAIEFYVWIQGTKIYNK